IHAFIHVATSDQVMNRLIEQNAIPMKPTDLAERFVVHVPPPGSMIVVDLSWKDKQSTADMLNAWSGIFIDQVMLDRRKTLESHRQHVKGALDNKQAEIAEVRRELQAITGSLERSDGPTNSAAQSLSRVNNRLQASEQHLDTVEVRRE